MCWGRRGWGCSKLNYRASIRKLKKRYVSKNYNCVLSLLWKVITHLTAALANIQSGAMYQHVDPKGPQETAVSAEKEFLAPYFTCPSLASLEEELALAWTDQGQECMAHNGWVMGQDPLVNFALPGSQVNFQTSAILLDTTCLFSPLAPGLPEKGASCLGRLCEAEVWCQPL